MFVLVQFPPSNYINVLVSVSDLMVKLPLFLIKSIPSRNE